MNIHSVAKYQKIDGGTLWSNTKNRKNEKFEQSNSAEKRGEKSHSAEKCKRGTLWDFLNIHSVAKYQKIDGGTLWSNKKNQEKMRNFNSLTVPKKGEKSHSAEKCKRGTLLLWNGFLSHVRGFGCVENEVQSTYGKSA